MEDKTIRYGDEEARRIKKMQEARSKKQRPRKSKKQEAR
jgi:hypothetical protein